MVGQISSTLTITIKKQAEDYTIEASGTKGIKVDPQLAPQLKTFLSDQQINNTLKNLSSPTAPAKTTEEDEKFRTAIKELGKALYDSLGKALFGSLFTDDQDLLRDLLREAQGSARADSGVRLRLQIEPPELAALPWETLNDGKDWLSAQSTTPLVRKLMLSNNRKPLQKLQISGALRVLFVGASPDGEGLPELKIEKTANELEALLAAPIRKKQIVFDKLLNATLEKLQQGLLKDYHILYFAGHGSPKGIFLDAGDGDDIIKEGKVIGRERGQPSLVSAETLAQALKGKQTRLVFLAACETSKTSGESRLLRGFAQELAERSNLPAIVAMQYSISDYQANPLTTQFFAALAAGRPVDVAMAEARSVLMKTGQVNRDVFSPVLYLQAEDGALFPKAKNWPAITALCLFLIAAIAGGVVWQQSKIAEFRNNIKTLAQDSRSSFSFTANPDAIDSLIIGLKAASTIKQINDNVFFRSLNINIDADNQISVSTALKQALFQVKEKNQLLGHQDKIYGVAFAPDGKTLASASADRTIKIWTKEGKLLHTLIGHTQPVISVAFALDGKTLASASADWRVKIWRTTDGKLLHTLIGHTNNVMSVAFAPDGKTLASASANGTVKIWRTTDGKLLRTLKVEGDKYPVNSVAFVPDSHGQTLASASADGTVKIWRTTDGKLLRTLKVEGDKYPVNSVAFAPDSHGQTLASASADGTVKIWRTTDGKLLHTLADHKYPVNSVAFAPDGQILASASNDQTVIIWGIYDHTKYIKIGTLKGHQGWVHSIAFAPDGQTLASASADMTVKIWTTGIKLLYTSIPTKREVNSVAFAPDRKTLASASDDGTVKIWTTEGELSRTLTGNISHVNSVTFAPDGQTLASASNDRTVKIWRITDGKLLHTLNGHEDRVNSVAFAPDRKTLASASDDKTVKIWRTTDGKLLHILTDHKDSVNSVAFAPDGKTLASASDDKTVKIWRTTDGKLLHTLNGHDNRVNSVTFASDGQTLASASDDGKVKIWTKESKLFTTVPGDINNTYSLNSVTFVPHSKTLVFATSGAVKICTIDGKDCKELLNFTSDYTYYNRAISTVAVSSDGKILASASYDGQIQILNLDFDKILQQSCDFARDYLNNKNKKSLNNINYNDLINLCKK